MTTKLESMVDLSHNDIYTVVKVKTGIFDERRNEYIYDDYLGVIDNDGFYTIPLSNHYSEIDLYGTAILVKKEELENQYTLYDAENSKKPFKLFDCNSIKGLSHKNFLVDNKQVFDYEVKKFVSLVFDEIGPFKLEENRCLSRVISRIDSNDYFVGYIDALGNIASRFFCTYNQKYYDIETQEMLTARVHQMRIIKQQEQERINSKIKSLSLVEKK